MPRARPAGRGGGGKPGRVIGGLVARPGRVLALAALLAVIGWVADTQTGVQSDVTKLVPTSMPALRNLDTLEKVTGGAARSTSPCAPRTSPRPRRCGG